jgi:hypothetical protein
VKHQPLLQTEGSGCNHCKAVKVKNTTQLKKVTLSVEIYNEKQADVLLKASLLGSYQINEKRHSSLTSSIAGCC